MATETARERVNEHELATPPDISHLVTEDDTPVDSIFAEKQERLLTEPLYSSWRGPEGGKFLATANVGLFSVIHEPPLVPDVLLSLDVSSPAADPLKKEHRSYFMWEYGKPPDVVIEVVSNREGNEKGSKFKAYARIGVPYYVIYDPDLIVLDHPLQISELSLRSGKYIDHRNTRLERVGLGLTIWDGEFQRMRAAWLRWTDAKGKLIPTGFECATLERQRADQERQRADQEHQRADHERQRADRLAAKLRKLGKNPE